MFAGANKIQMSSSGAGSSLQNLVFQKTGAERVGSSENQFFPFLRRAALLYKPVRPISSGGRGLSPECLLS